MTYTIQDAQINLHRLLAEAEAGEQVVIECWGSFGVWWSMTTAHSIP